VVTYDPLLNKDPDAIVAFIQHHSTHPELWVEVEGYHFEDHHTTESVRDRDGNLSQQTRTESRKVIDFQTKVDVTPHVRREPAIFIRQIPDPPPASRSFTCRKKDSPATNQAAPLASSDDRTSIDSTCDLISPNHDSEGQGAGLTASSSTKRALRDVAEEYVDSTRYLKEFLITKVVSWDFDTVQTEVDKLFRARGYCHIVRVHFIYRNKRIVIRSANAWLRWYHNRWVWGFLVITCLWMLVL
ncbi:hypothetical protein BJ085DRAFT_12657, partial [Dimargaris cristalligena]